MNPKSGDVRISAQTRWPWMRELQVLDDDAGLDDAALAVDQPRELAQRPAIYASPLAFEWRPTGSSQSRSRRSRISSKSGHPPSHRNCLYS